MSIGFWRREKFGRALLLAGVILGWAWLGGPARAQYNTPSMDAWFANGPVYALARTSDTVYLGGSFSYMGPYTGSFVPLDGATGQPAPVYPECDGSITACAADGAGGWYVAGNFSQIGNLERHSLAHIRADGTADPAWDSGTTETLYNINALAATSTTLYAGGSFLHIGGQPRTCIAAFDAATGHLTDWQTSMTTYSGFQGIINGGVVHSLAATSSHVYVGGEFETIGDAPLSSLAELDAVTGEATSWDPYAELSIRAMAMTGNTLYVMGQFENLGQKLRHGLAAVDLATHQVTDWDPQSDLDWFVESSDDIITEALAVSGGTVYVGGNFTTIGGQSRNGLAALDAVTGLATSWNPNAKLNPPLTYVNSLAVSGSTVYVGASQGQQHKTQIKDVAIALDAKDDSITRWFSYTNSSWLSWMVSGTHLSACGSQVYAWGDLSSVGGLFCRNLVAMDIATGRGRPMASGIDGTVKALAATSSTVYAGGEFTQIGGYPRSHLAALDAITGQVTAWNPGADSTVSALAVTSSTVFAAGNFTQAGGQARNSLAALNNAGNGTATAWNPSVSGNVAALAVYGKMLYVGGSFTKINDQPRNCLAALDTATGEVSPWDPQTTYSSYDPTIMTLAANGGKIYVGGIFTYIGGQACSSLAELDPVTGAATQWNANVIDNSSTKNSPGVVLTLALSDSTVYVGGRFDTVGGEARQNLAAVDIASGAVTPWDPALHDVKGSTDWSARCLLAVPGSAVYSGGVMAQTYTSDFPYKYHHYYSRFDFPLQFQITTQPVSQVANPGATVSFGVEASGGAPLTYRWQKDGTDLQNGGRIGGATSPTLTLSAVTQADAGGYRCVVRNPGGTVYSNTATLGVNAPPTILSHPAALTLRWGQAAQFSVSASGTAPLKYQWKRNGVSLTDSTRITGSAQSALKVNAVTLDDAGLYACTVTNDAGSTTSQSAGLTVNAPLVVASPYGSPTPGVGQSNYTASTQVTARMPVTTLPDTAGTTRRVLTGWTAKGAINTSGSGDTLTFTLDRPTTVTWQWKTQYKLTTTALPAGKGSVTQSDGKTAAAGWYDAGTTVNLRAIGATYYHFGYWWGDVRGSSASLSRVLDKPYSVTAMFRDSRNGAASWGMYP